jgi:hypothetical protein
VPWLWVQYLYSWLYNRELAVNIQWFVIVLK